MQVILHILDVDGSRSDIGMFGGPLGQKYTYLDLAPRPPRNLTATLDSGLVLLKWNKNTEADLYRYRVYRDTVPNFIYDTTKIVAVVADTFYYDIIPDKYSPKDFYYKITAIDSAYNQSAASEEVHVNITAYLRLLRLL
jgi:fibronectin type 3 domain-containing protein